MIKTKILLLKTIEGNGTLRVRVRVRFLLFCSELVPTNMVCYSTRTGNVWGGNVRWTPSLSKSIPAENKIRKNKKFQRLPADLKTSIFRPNFGKLLWGIWKIKSLVSNLNLCPLNQLAPSYKFQKLRHFI